MVGHSGLGPRDLLSPESGSLVRQLEVRIKELKGWLRDTELFIFNSCLRQESEGTMNAEKQLQYFKVTKTPTHGIDTSWVAVWSKIKYEVSTCVSPMCLHSQLCTRTSLRIYFGTLPFSTAELNFRDTSFYTHACTRI